MLGLQLLPSPLRSCPFTFFPFFPPIRVGPALCRCSPVLAGPACPLPVPLLHSGSLPRLRESCRRCPGMRHRPRPSDAAAQHCVPGEPGGVEPLRGAAAHWGAAVRAGTGGTGSSSPVWGCSAHRDGTGKLLADVPAAPVVPGGRIPGTRAAPRRQPAAARNGRQCGR